jgi:hypothetical protein
MVNNIEQAQYFEAVQLGIKDNMGTKSFFDNSIIERNYNILNHSIWEIPFEIEFAVTTASGLHYDIKGSMINNFMSPDRVKNVFINIFPSTNKSFCIFSWLKGDDVNYKEFGKQFTSLKDDDKKKYLNNLLPLITENIVISPRLWDKWDPSKQQEFNALFNLTLIMEEDDYKNMILDTHFDLFETV